MKIERSLMSLLVGGVGVFFLVATSHLTYAAGMHDDAQLLVQSIGGIIVGLLSGLPWFFRR